MSDRLIRFPGQAWQEIEVRAGVAVRGRVLLLPYRQLKYDDGVAGQVHAPEQHHDAAARQGARADHVRLITGSSIRGKTNVDDDTTERPLPADRNELDGDAASAERTDSDGRHSTADACPSVVEIRRDSAVALPGHQYRAGRRTGHVVSALHSGVSDLAHRPVGQREALQFAAERPDRGSDDARRRPAETVSRSRESPVPPLVANAVGHLFQQSGDAQASGAAREADLEARQGQGTGGHKVLAAVLDGASYGLCRSLGAHDLGMHPLVAGPAPFEKGVSRAA